MSRLRFRILTPARPVVDQEVDTCSVTAAGGELGILPGHAALLAALRPGPASYTDAGSTRWFAVSQGFVEVNDDVVTVLVRAAEAAEDIDVERARKRLAEREEEVRRQVLTDAEMQLAERSIAKQVVRIQLASREGSIP